MILTWRINSYNNLKNWFMKTLICNTCNINRYTFWTNQIQNKKKYFRHVSIFQAFLIVWYKVLYTLHSLALVFKIHIFIVYWFSNTYRDLLGFNFNLNRKNNTCLDDQLLSDQVLKKTFYIPDVDDSTKNVHKNYYFFFYLETEYIHFN